MYTYRRDIPIQPEEDIFLFLSITWMYEYGKTEKCYVNLNIYGKGFLEKGCNFAFYFYADAYLFVSISDNKSRSYSILEIY